MISNTKPTRPSMMQLKQPLKRFNSALPLERRRRRLLLTRKQPKKLKPRPVETNLNLSSEFLNLKTSLLLIQVLLQLLMHRQNWIH